MANWPSASQRAPDRACKENRMVVGIVLVVLLAVRVYLSQQGPELHPWHTWRADEMSVRELDNADFAGYLAREKGDFHRSG